MRTTKTPIVEQENPARIAPVIEVIRRARGISIIVPIPYEKACE
jgi:hypothetical protein